MNSKYDRQIRAPRQSYATNTHAATRRDRLWGLAYLIIRCGYFFQLVMPLKEGHISIAFEPRADPVTYVEQVTHILQDHVLLLGGYSDSLLDRVLERAEESSCDKLTG